MDNKIKLLYFLLLFVLQNGLAQNDQVRFFATAQPSEVVVGQQFNISFTLTNSSGSDIFLPSLKDFTIISGPNKSVSVQSINGDWKKVTEYSYELMPKKSGRFVIGSASIKTRSNTLKTNPVTIIVNDAPAILSQNKSGNIRAADAGKDFFIQVVPNKNTPFIGEQVLVDFVLFTKVSIQDFQVIEEPGFTKSYAQELKFYSEPQSQQTINGKNFIRKLIKRYAVFPQEEGEIEIQPMTIEANIVSGDSDPFSGFFGSYAETRTYSSKRVLISGKSLPIPIPDHYTGAVGSWTIDFAPSTTEISKNDALSLILTMEGDGDIKNVQFPKLNFSDDFESYPPKVVEEHSSESNGKLISKKVFEFLLVPKKSGTSSISSELSWFDPVLQKFQNKKFGPVSITVLKSTGNSTGTQEEAGDDLSSGLVPQLKKYLAWLAGIVISSVLVWLIFVFRSTRLKNANKNLAANKPSAQSFSSVPENSPMTDPFKGLQSAIDLSQSEKFYSLLNQNLRTWLGEKLSIAASSRTNTSILEELKNRNTDPQIISKVKTIFSTCEQVLYAGQDKSAMMHLFMEYLREIKNEIT